MDLKLNKKIAQQMEYPVTYENISYGRMVEWHKGLGTSCYLGVKVHFFNRKGVLIGNFYKFVPYEELSFSVRRNEVVEYPKYFIHGSFKAVRNKAFSLLLRFISGLTRWTQKYMD